MLVFADYAFFFLHTLLIVFNMTGFAWRRMRKIHLVTVALTMFSWFALGAFYGWGYCICTDWHFQVREKLGYIDPETSYIQLLSVKILGLSISRSLADWLAGIVLLYILIATAIVWLRPKKSPAAGQ